MQRSLKPQKTEHYRRSLPITMNANRAYNPRRHGERTLNEVKSDLDFKQQLKDYDQGVEDGSFCHNSEAAEEEDAFIHWLFGVLDA